MHLHTHNRRRRAIREALLRRPHAHVPAAPPALEEAKGDESGSIIGFWAIPHRGGYMKLKILERYTLRSPRFIATYREREVGAWTENAPAPVWPALVHLDALYPHFRWLEPPEQYADDLYNPRSARHADAVTKYQLRLMSRGWEFLILRDDVISIGSRGFPLMAGAMLREVVLGEGVADPVNVRVDGSRATTVVIHEPDGTISHSLTVQQAMEKLGLDGDEEEEEDDEKGGKRAKRPPNPMAKIMGTDGRAIRNMSRQELMAAFEPHAFASHVKGMAPAGRHKFVGYLKTFLARAAKEGWGIDVESYMEAFAPAGGGRLDEVTFKSLYHSTIRNGQYAAGGMVRIDGRWVIDPAVPGRMDNARFVITRSPRVHLDEDGMFRLDYRFQSRDDRNTTGVAQTGYVKFLPPDKGFLKAVLRWAKRLFVSDTPWNSHVHVACSCFGPGTPILMADGTTKPVEDVAVGDRVITHRGRAREVTRAMVRRVRPDESVYEMRTQGHSDPFIVTGNHPFYSLRGNDLCLCGCGRQLRFTNKHTLSPPVMLSRKCIQGHGGRTLTEEDRSSGHFEWVDVDNMRGAEWFLTPWVTPGVTEMNPDLARLLGYYAAEGSLGTRGRTVKLTFGRHEDETVAADAVRAARALGYSARRGYPKGRSWMNVIVGDDTGEFREMCATHIGRGSHEKRLSPAIMGLGREPMRELLLGMFLGDGTVTGRGSSKYFTVSRHLASQSYTMALMLGIRCTVAYHNKNVEPKEYWSLRDKRMVTLNRSVTYSTTLSIEGSNEMAAAAALVTGRKVRTRARIKSTYEHPEGQTRAMLSRTPIAYDGVVHDLTVDEDESFVAAGVAVHNCPDFRYRWHWVLAQRGASHEPTGAGTDATNQPPNRTNPQRLISLCKHLSAVGPYVQGAPKEFRRITAELSRSQGDALEPVGPNEPPEVAPGATLDGDEVEELNADEDAGDGEARP